MDALSEDYFRNDVGKKGHLNPTTTVHWHQMAPNLVITPFGSLVSGGMEATIVKYSLSKTKETAAPSFLPHLQANVMTMGLSNDGSLLSVVLEDNSIHFVLLATMTVLSSAEVGCIRHKTLPRSVLPLMTDPFYPDAIVISANPGKLTWIDAGSGVSIRTVRFL